MNEFEGDVLLSDTPDGFDLSIVDGLIQPDKGLRTAVFLSLFGGNTEDFGLIEDRKAWFGNYFSQTSKNEKMISRFQAILTGLPFSLKNRQEAQAAAVADLKWLVDDGIIDEIDAVLTVNKKNSVTLSVTAKKNGVEIDGGKYEME